MEEKDRVYTFSVRPYDSEGLAVVEKLKERASKSPRTFSWIILDILKKAEDDDRDES